MSKRSQWKGPTVPYSFYQKLKVTKNKNMYFERNATIVPALLGKILKVYNGKIFMNIKITQDMLGYKLGDFSFTKVKKRNKNKTK